MPPIMDNMTDRLAGLILGTLALFAALVHLPIDDRQVVRTAEAG